MTQNGYSSPITVIVPDNDTYSLTESDDTCSLTESDSSGWGPENQLGLEPGVQFGFQRNRREVALDKKGKITHHEEI